MSESDEFDHYLSDNDLDLESIDLLERSINSNADSRQQSLGVPPAARAAPTRGTPAPARPPAARPAQPTPRATGSKAFLRPPKPPPRQNRAAPAAVVPAVTSPVKPPPPPRGADAQPPPPKRRRVSLNEKGEEGFVDPNPFKAKANGVDVIKEEEGAPPRGAVTSKTLGRAEDNGYVEENMPELRRREGRDGEMLGYELEPRRGVTVLPQEARSRAEEANGAKMVDAAVRPVGQRLVRRATGNHATSLSEAAPRDGDGGHGGGRDCTSGESRTDLAGRAQSEVRGVQGSSVSGSGGMSDTDKRELDELRKERAKLQAALKTSEQERHKISEELLNKAGESSVVRNRMVKAELAHANALKEEQREREKLAAALQAKEQELHNEREKTKTKEAFQQLEQNSMMHSSARKSSHRLQAPGSTQRSINRGMRGASVPATSGRMREGESPSIGRSRGERASSIRASPLPQRPQPTFANFHNSFAESPASANRARRTRDDSINPKAGQAGREGEREGSMAPPPFPMTGGKSRKSALKPKEATGKERNVEERTRGKGKGRAIPEEDESFFSEGHGGEVSFDETITDARSHARYVEEDEENEEDEGGWDWEWVEEDREWTGEILAAVFSHTTFTSIDVSSAHTNLGVPSTQLRSTFFSGSTAPQFRSSAFSAPTWISRSSLHSASARSSSSMSRQTSHNSATSTLPSPAPETSASAGPVPTFHALTNLRFPPTASPDHVAAYETATRSLFTLLGRRLDPRLPLSSQPSLPYPSAADFDPTTSALHLCSNLSHSFQALLAILDDAGLLGPIAALLSLINHLIFLFPLFVRSILENTNTGDADDTVGPSTKGGLLAIVARLISRYGKPPHPSSLPSSLGIEASDKRAPQFQSRRSRQAARTAGGRTRKRAMAGGEEEHDRVPLEDPEKRESLLQELVAVLEGVAWRYASGGVERTRSGEAQLIGFLRTHNTVSTLLDPKQSTAVLHSTSRTLALLGGLPAFYRELLAIKISGADQQPETILPLFERVATLMNLQREPDELYDLHSALLVLSSSLLTHQSDSLRIITQSPRFIPEGLLKRIYRDVETLWDWDGRSVGGNNEVRSMLRRTTQRLVSCVTLLYYLFFAPHSSLLLSAIFENTHAFREANETSNNSSLAYVQDWSRVALGTLAFTEDVPTWAAPDEEGFLANATTGAGRRREIGEGEEGSRLLDMKYLAQEILEAMAPDEIQDIGDCFGVYEDDEEEQREQHEVEAADASLMHE
ncbi:hypothetical protein JCM11491_002625 [Sporobolomyces phaffii]